MDNIRSLKPFLVALLMLLLVASAFLLGRTTGHPPSSAEGPMTTASMTPEEKGQSERKILYWRAPMDPNEIYDKPGKSRMGMDLVPVYEDDMATNGVVSIDPVTLQNIGVRTMPVTIESLRHTVRTTGRFEMDEQGAHTVSLKVSGWVEQLYVDYEGTLVQEGDPLLELYSPELVSTQEEYLLALRNVQRLRDGSAAQDAQRLLQAARRRLAYWDLTEGQIRRLEENGEPQRTLTFFAPVSGEVMRKKVVEGQHTTAGQPLMDIMDISKIWLMVDVYEQDLGWITDHMPARIELPYQPGQTYEGHVEHIYYMLNQETRSAQARIVLPRAVSRALKPGMYATVYLSGRETAPTPVVPEEAVLRTGEQEAVLLALGEGRFRPVEVETGIQAGGKVQILRGLSGHERVVTSAQFLIDSEARLKSTIGAMRTGDAMAMPETQNQDTMDHDAMDHEAMGPATQGPDTLQQHQHDALQH